MAAPKHKTLKVTGHALTLKLPPKLPFAITRYVNSNTGSMDIPGTLNAILGEEQAEKVWDLGLDIDEGTALVDQIISKYGVDTGK